MQVDAYIDTAGGMTLGETVNLLVSYKNTRKPKVYFGK